MLAYRNAVIALVSAAAVIVSLWTVAGTSLWWFCLPLAGYLGVVAYGSSRIDSSFFIETRCVAQTELPHIALTFDDGPVSTTPAILDILRQHQAPATFFCIGQRIQDNPALLRQIDADGHLIGNHTFTHHYLLDLFSAQRLSKEIQDTNDLITAAVGKQAQLFRPPYGVTTPNLARAIRKNGLQCIGWSVRSMDTVIKDEQKLLGNMLKMLKPGAVFLFHDSSAATVGILDEFITQARKSGFHIVPLDQLLSLTPYA